MDVSGENYESILNIIKYDLKQDMVCGVFPSLQYKTFNNLSIILWRNKLGHADLTLFKQKNISEKMNFFAKEIVEMVSDLSSIPVLFKPQLKEMVGLIGKEIEIFFEDHVNMLYFELKNMFKIYWDNICWTEQSTINKVKTIKNIIDNASMSIIEKYILACNYCLEEKIDYLLKLLPENFIDFYEDKKKLRLFFFWTFYKRGEIERFSKFAHGMETFTYILTWAINQNMETAVQYIWENFADIIEKEEVVNEIYPFEVVNLNISFYILQNMNEIFDGEVFEEFYCNVLSKLHSISRWCNIVPVTKYLSELNSETFNVTEAFKVASFCWHEKIFEVEQFSDLWNEMCIKFELSLEDEFIQVCEEVFYNYEDPKEDLYIEKLLLGMCTSKNKRRLMNNIDINENIAKLIIDNGTHSFDILFKEFFKSEEETELFKIKFFNEYSSSVCSELIDDENYERLDEYLINFCPEEEISKFKNEYYLYDESVIQSISITSLFTKVDSLTKLNKLLNWSFEGNEEKINQLKAKVYDLESSKYSLIHLNFFKEFQQYINENDWKLVEKFWNWIFFATEKKIVTVEEKFARIKNIFNVLFQSTRFYLGTIKYRTLFKMIISLCFKNYNFEEIIHVFNRENDVAALVEEYLEFDNRLELNEMLGRSFCLKEKNYKFTSCSMFYHKCLLMFELIKSDITIYNVEFFFKWFNPLIQSAKLFKKSFLNFVANKNDHGYKILKKREMEKLIMMVRQYLMKMLIDVLNQ